MSVKNFFVGQKVKLNPVDEGYNNNYSLDGVAVGDVGVICGIDEIGQDIVINFTRQDGSVCEGFYAFPKDLEIVE